MIKTVLFDFDGTLVNSKKVTLQVYNELAKKCNYIPITLPALDNLSKLSITDRCKKLNIPLHHIPLLLYKARKNFKNHLANYNLFDGIEEVLHKLNENGFKLGIVSSNSKDLITEFLKTNKLDFFESILSSKNIFGKHITINNYLKKFNLSSNEVIYVGDEIRDTISCKKINVPIISVTWGYDAKELLEKESPNYLVSKPDEIIKIIKSENKGFDL
jgi:phosphoglycolate phosphatase